MSLGEKVIELKGVGKASGNRAGSSPQSMKKLQMPLCPIAFYPSGTDVRGKRRTTRGLAIDDDRVKDRHRYGNRCVEKNFRDGPDEARDTLEGKGKCMCCGEITLTV